MRFKAFYIVSSFLFLMASCVSNVFKKEIPDLLGLDNVEIIESESVEEWGGLRGKGYAVETYLLSDITAQTFRNKTFKSLPDKKENKAWHKYNWTTGEIDSSFSEVLSVAFDYGGKKRLEEQSSQIKKILKKPGVYYSFYYKPNKDNPRDVQFFVFDTYGKKLYVIESNV